MMSEPTRDQRETAGFPPETSIVPAAIDESALPVEPDPEPYSPGPLFSKKVMIGWALATLAVWLWITMIAPIVVESIKAAIVSRLEEAGSNTPGKTVIRTRNGTTITRTETGVTIERNVPGAPTVTIPIPPATTAPAQPAPAPPPTKPKS